MKQCVKEGFAMDRLAEAKKLLSKDELEEFHWTVQEYIDRGTGVISGDWAKQLENASARVHISRLEALEMQLQEHAEELTGRRIKVTTAAAETAYTESYYHTAYEMQRVAGVGVNLHKIDKKRLEKVLSRPWTADNATFTARCWTDKNKLVDLVNKELTRMVATGAKPDQAIKNIANAFNTSKSNAGRVVMTESAYFASEARKECFNYLEVERYQIRSAMDGNVCGDCGDMDSEIFKMSDFKAGSTAPPFHPWCRCTTVPYYEDMKVIGERWMRDPKTGKGGYVPSDMTYKEWKEIYVDKTSTMEEWQAKRNGIVNSGKTEFVSPTTGEVLELEKPSFVHVSEKCSDEFVSGLSNAVDSIDNETVKALFYEHGDVVRVIDPNYRGTPYTEKSGIYMDADKVAAGSKYKTPYQSFFHEMAHDADNRFQFYRSEDLYNTLKAEGKVFSKRCYNAAGINGKPQKGDMAWHKAGKAASGILGVEHSDGVLSGVSDILEGVTGISYPLGTGHGTKYWGTEKSGQKQEFVCSEFVAHYCESAVANPEYAKALKGAFPNSCGILEKLIWEAIT